MDSSINNIFFRNLILYRLSYLPAGKYLDVTEITDFGDGIKIVDSSEPIVNRIKIPDYNVIVSPNKYNEIMYILTS